MKALVTGATGIIGANLVRELLERNWNVRVLLRSTSSRRAVSALPVEIAIGDVSESSSLKEAMAGVAVVFHAAARFAYWGVSGAELETVAVQGTINVIDAAAASGAQRVVLTSSSVIFGSSNRPELRNETSQFTDADATPYAVSKVQQTLTALRTSRKHHLELVAACPTLSVGSYDYGLSTSNAIIAKYLNDPFRTTFDGGCNIVAARDIARGHLLLAESGTAQECYILGADNVTWRAAHECISDICATPGPISKASHTSAYLAAAWGEAIGTLTGSEPAVTRAEAQMIGRYYWYGDGKARALGYAPVPTHDALQGAVQWLAQTEHLHPLVRATLNLR